MLEKFTSGKDCLGRLKKQVTQHVLMSCHDFCIKKLLKNKCHFVQPGISSISGFGFHEQA